MSNIPGVESISYVVGHGRGGTTWLGSLFALHEGVQYLFEPFASQAHLFTGFDTQTLLNNGRQIRFGKRGEPTVENPYPSFFRYPEVEVEDTWHREVLQHHLARLVARYFNTPVPRLFIKQPRVENFPWVADAVGADQVLFIDRHPLGIIGSYHRGKFWRWMDVEWDVARNTLPGKFPSLASAIDHAERPEERLLVLSYARSLFGRDYCRRKGNCLRVSYEQLCENPFHTMRALVEALGLDFSEDYCSALRAELGRRSRDPHFLATHKKSSSRADAWRRELPYGMIRGLRRFSKEHGLPIEFPDDGLEPLSWPERRASDFYALRGLMKRFAEVGRRVGRSLAPEI